MKVVITQISQLITIQMYITIMSMCFKPGIG